MILKMRSLKLDSVVWKLFKAYKLILVTDQCISADSDLDLVLNTLVQGAVESVDAVAQKTCFSVLTKLVQSWGEFSFHDGNFHACHIIIRTSNAVP